MNMYEAIHHELRDYSYDRSKGQVDQIINLINQIEEKTGKEIVLNNLTSNRYTLTLDGVTYTFGLYKDIINALELINKFI